MEAWERIYTIMNEEGLNKNSLSRRMGLQNNVTITKIINDHRNPQETTLEKVADGKANKVFIPFDTTKSMGALGALSEVVKENKSNK